LIDYKKEDEVYIKQLQDRLLALTDDYPKRENVEEQEPINDFIFY
jgi:hypothetical protein